MEANNDVGVFPASAYTVCMNTLPYKILILCAIALGRYAR